MNLLLPICGKFTRAQLAHQIFSWKIWCASRRVSTFHILQTIVNYLFTCHIWNIREVLVSCREKWNFFIGNFHVLGLFMAKKHDLSDEKFSVCHAPLPLPLPLNAKFVPRLQPRAEVLESWNFGSRSLLGQLDVLHTQNFEIQVP
jgi:hypothetical protein